MSLTVVASTKQISNPPIGTLSYRLPSSFLWALIFFVIFLVITIIIPPRCARDGYFAALKDKHRYLHSLNSPKIVFIGGSNLAFGLDSTLIKNKFHMPVANMGICAPFGLRYILEEVKDNIRSGDTIVIVPEYGILQNTVDGTPDLMHAPEVYAPSALFILRAYTDSPKSFFNLLAIIRSIPAAKWQGFYAIATKMWQQGHYNASLIDHWEMNNQIGSSFRFYFNTQGDYFGHFAKPHLDFKPNWEIIGCTSKEAGVLINNFYRYTQAHGARAVLIPPPIPIEDLRPGRCASKSIANWPAQKLNIPVLARPQRYAFAYQFFYQPPYHLNAAGRTLRTTLIADDLDHFFASNNSSPTSIKSHLLDKKSIR